jgi:YVTN family beta-propeller protein
MLEEIGQPGEAIKLYSEVVSQAQKNNNRALAAKAQFRIGVLHKRLGRATESQRAFETVVGEYADQAQVVRRAQARLAITTVNRKEKPALVIKRTGPSPDGQFLASLTFPEKQFQSSASFDPGRQRLYLVTQKIEEAEPSQKLLKGQRLVVRLVYWPSTLVVIDTKTQTVFKTIPFPVYLGQIAYNPTTDRLYASALVDGHVRVIDPNTFSTTAIIPVPGYPAVSVHCINPVTNKIYIGSQGFAGNDKLFVIDGATNAVSGPFDLGGVTTWILVNQATNRIYVGADDGMRVFRGEDNSVLTDLPGMQVSAIDSVYNRLYARAAQSGRYSDLLVLDGNTHAILTTFHYDDNFSEKMDLDLQSGRLYVPLESRNQVAVIDTKTLKEINRVGIAGYPADARVDQATGTVYFYAGANLTLHAVSRERLEPENISEEFFDEFNELELDSDWSVLKGFGSYSLSKHPGFLRFHTAVPAGSAPFLLLTRKFRGNQWTLDTKVSYFTGTTGGGRDLRLMITFGSPLLENQKEPDYIVITRRRDSWNNCCPGTIAIIAADNGLHTSLGPVSLNSSETYYWRIKRAGNAVTIETSTDGVNFTVLGTHAFGSQIEGLVQYFNVTFRTHATSDAFADYDYVRLKKN